MLLWIDSFDNYGTTANVAPSPAGIVGRRYPNIANESAFRIRAGRLGGYALDIPSYYYCYYSQSDLTTNDTVVAGFALQLGTFANDAVFFALYDGTTLGVNLCIQSNGNVKIKCGTTVLATVPAGLSLGGTWTYLELKVKCGSSGTYELRADGVTVASGSGNTKAGSHNYHDGFRFCGTTEPYSSAIDDFYFLDASGSANNDFLGNMRVTVMPRTPLGTPHNSHQTAAATTPESTKRFVATMATMLRPQAVLTSINTSRYRGLPRLEASWFAPTAAKLMPLPSHLKRRASRPEPRAKTLDKRWGQQPT